MSYQEIAKSIIDQLPSDKLVFVVNILQSIGELSGVSVHPQLEPNQETLDAMEELEQEKGMFFDGATKDFFSALRTDA